MKNMSALLLEEILFVRDDGTEEAIVTLFVRDDEFEGGFNWTNGFKEKEGLLLMADAIFPRVFMGCICWRLGDSGW